jgi:hypothetical protein
MAVGFGRAGGRRVVRFCLTPRFWSDASASTGILLSLVLSTLVVSVGCAIDLGRWLDARSKAARALSAAVLSGSRMLQITVGDTEAALRAARQAFQDNFSVKMPFVLDALEFEIAADRATMIAHASAWMKPLALSVIGIERLPVLGTPTGAPSARLGLVGASSGTSMGTSYEVALAIDLSQELSMAGLDHLRAAASEFVDIVVRNDTSNVTARLAIVPFSAAVNLGDALIPIAGVARPGVCESQGCTQYMFSPRGRSDCQTGSSSISPFGTRCRARVFHVGECVGERSGAAAFTDESPSIAPPPLAYPNALGLCPRIPNVAPLSTDREALKRVIARMEPDGPSAPQLGTAWAWYMLSPEWSHVWPPASSPAPYSDLAMTLPNRRPRLRKVAVLVHTGSVPIQHCRGVDDRIIDCAAPGGRSAHQTRELCTAMRRRGLSIHVIAFGSQIAREMEEALRDTCAGRDSVYHEAPTGEALRQAFRDVALQISTLVETQ